jgi:hypothetical protein
MRHYFSTRKENSANFSFTLTPYMVCEDTVKILMKEKMVKLVCTLFGVKGNALSMRASL